MLPAAVDEMRVKPPYRMPDLSWLATQGSPLPEDFLWGVANASFQVEGGYNEPGGPTNNWASWEASGKVVPAGDALRFWGDWDRHFALAQGIGLNAFRLSLDWTRLQPRGPDGLDPASVRHYADILAGCRARGLEPVVTLHHFTHPAWLGTDPWLEDLGPDAFERFVAAAVPAVGRALVERGQEPVRWWVTVNEPNALALVSYAVGGFPREAPVGRASFRRALDGLLAGHVRAYRAVHRAYRDEGWPRPMVASNTYCMTAYWLDRGLLDLALAHEQGVAEGSLKGHLSAARERFDTHLEGLGRRGSRLADRLAERVLIPDPLTALPRYVEALRSGEDAAHDYAGLDYYVGPLADYLRMPFTGSWREREKPWAAQLWETTIRPEGLRRFILASAGTSRPVLVAENGMCTRVRHGRTQRRRDGWERPAFLRAHLAELLEAAHQGADVAGYLHWTLADNYEWGSYEPAFGLHGVDRRGERPVILGRDAQSLDAAGTYREIVRALRTADAGAARAALVLLSG